MYVCMYSPAGLQSGHAVHRHAQEHYLPSYQLRLLGILLITDHITYIQYVIMYVEGVSTYLLLGRALEHGVHEAAEHDQQLLLVDVAQPQRGPTYIHTYIYWMYVCGER